MLDLRLDINIELIVISNPFCFKEEALLINRLFEAGLGVFHLRKPGLDRVAYKRLIGEIHPAYHPQLAIHQFHELREEYRIGRLHFTEQHRRAAEGKDLTSNFTLSTSIHDLSEFAGLSDFSYAFYGPVFDSLSKPGYQGMILPDFRWLATGKDPKLIALGGIDPTNLRQVRQMGFDGAAILGVLWNEPLKALDTFKKLQHQWTQTDLM
jgi:thiamine-phosphate pyrophosphorylase